MKSSMFSLTLANRVCFIGYSNLRVGTCNIQFAQQVATKLNKPCVYCLQTSLSINSAYTTIVITSYKLQKCDVILLRLLFWGMNNFQTIQDKFSVGQLYDLKFIIVKEKCTLRILKISGDAMFQN